MAGAAEAAASAPANGPTGEGAATTPHLELDGFSGPLEALLTLARAHRIDLARISLSVLVEQLVQALQERTAAQLAEKADWLVMAAWLAMLRTRLLLPPEAREHRAAAVEAERLRGALLAAEEMQALAAWLVRRPQLGRDVFARGQPELVGIARAADHPVNVIEFLWAALDLFDDDLPPVDTLSVYRPPTLDLYAVQDARARILHVLAQTLEAQPLDRLLPDEVIKPRVEDATSVPVPRQPRSALRLRSAWSSTFAACLELAKQGKVALAQEGGGFAAPVLVSPGVSSSVGAPSPPAPGETAPCAEGNPR